MAALQQAILRTSYRDGFFSSGAIEALKYIALVSMVIDHANKAFYGSSLAWAIPVGRLAMPIFATLIAYNLARPNADYGKLLRRLFVVGLIAMPFHSAVNGGGWLPLNVLFTFALAVLVIGRIEMRNYACAIALFVVGGFFVDYLWAGPALVIAGYAFFRRPTPQGAAAVALSLAVMCLVVGNFWAFLAIAPIGAATLYTPAVPRIRWLFWAAYPAHLAILANLPPVALF